MIDSNKISKEGLEMLANEGLNSRLVSEFIKFKGERSFEARLELTKSICEDFDKQIFKKEEQEIIKEILILLARNVEVKIRAILTETLNSSSALPYDVAMELANDLQEISIPILENSPVLSDEDLINIIRDTKVLSKVEAIAKRENVNISVSEAIVDKGHPEAVNALIDNQNAEIDGNIQQNIIAIYQDKENILKNMVAKCNITPEISQQICDIVGQHVVEEISAKYNIKRGKLVNAAEKANEEITLEGNENTDIKGTNNIVKHLYDNGKLSHSIVLRSLSRTDIGFFEASLSYMAGVSLINTRKLINSCDTRGISALYRASKMPNSMFEATMLLLEEVIKIQGQPSRVARQKRLKDKLEKKKDLLKTPNINYFIALINRDLQQDT